MSAGLLFRESLFRLRSLQLPAGVTELLVRVIEADRVGRSFIADAAWEAMSSEFARCRGAGVVMLHASSSLGDDLSDGEAHYLENPVTLAPALQWILQHAGTATLLDAGVSVRTASDAHRLLARAGGWAVEEWSSDSWSSERYLNFAQGIAGHQLQAYLELLWDGTALAVRATEVGVALGAVSLIHSDIIQNKPRWRSLSPSEQQRACHWTLTHTERLAEYSEPCVRSSACRIQEHIVRLLERF